ncbi:HNH endonuclease [uncultured Clostridium sp.]|uniref:HNH endonuclease n=1 Tax=uncultured Clostridium sp. TaxID=59620 RepID=UPI0028F015B1|nr:HNH endonuclease [uncultured Clostridium sp.]
MALMKLCRCGKVIPQGTRYCEACKERYAKDKADKNRYYDKHKRNKKSRDFYNSPEWLKTRAYVLAKYKGLDLYAFFILDKIEYADTVHHIVELEEGWNRRKDITNLFPLTGVRHNVIDGMYRRDKEGTQRLLFDLLKRWEQEMG